MNCYLDLLSKILRNEIYEPKLPVPSPEEYVVVEEILAQLSEEGVSFEFEADAGTLVGALQYAKRSRNVHTYVSARSLQNISDIVDKITHSNVEGDLIDCGVMRGGTAIFMAGALKSYGEDRSVYMADTFRGLPAPKPVDGNFVTDFWARFSEKLAIYNADCSASLEEVLNNFSKYDLYGSNIKPLKGLFCDTLYDLPTNVKFSLIRIDADWFESTFQALDALYEKLSINGFVVIDDYKLRGCRKAVDKFRLNNKIAEPICYADCESGVIFWQKIRSTDASESHGS